MEMEAKQLSCTKGGKVLFRNLSFSLISGQLILIQGENGAGKSTLLRLLAGLTTADKGKILYHADPQTKIGYIGHQNALHPTLTVLENIHFLLALSESVEDKSALSYHLEGLGLAAYTDKPCDQLSQGQRRKVALCALLVKNRPLWLLDEPLTALDDRSIQWFQQAMQKHLDQGGAAIMASHIAGDYPVPPTFIHLSSMRQVS